MKSDFSFHPARILIVEDEAPIALSLEKRLTSMGYEVYGAMASGEEALKLLERDRPDLVLMDIKLVGALDGIQTAERIEAGYDVPVVFMTGYADEEKLKRAVSARPFGYILKPFQDRELRVNLEMALYAAEVEAGRRQAEEALRRAHEELEQRVAERTADLERAYGQLKAQSDERRRVEETLARAQKIAQIGNWTWDARTKRLYMSDEGYSIFGFEPGEIAPGPAAFLKRIHPEDRRPRLVALAAALRRNRPYEIEQRLVMPDGTEKIVHEQAEVVRDEKFRPVQVVGTVQDITRRKQVELRLLEREEELRRQTRRLEEANIGLKVLIQHRDEEKQTLRENTVNTIRKLVLPFVDKLKMGHLSPEQEACLSVIETNLKEIASPAVARLASGHLGLTPTELKVAGLVKEGKTIDEISELLHISDNAVRFHRKNIRAKLGLKRKKMNLRSYLQQMS
ncbi:MAG: response regulator [Thermodesulfobacteriota bacterium]